MTVAVVTPWYRHLELQADYDRALELGPWPDELLIVDNGSSPPLEFAAIRNDDNLGFCKASNQGLEAASSDVVVFLNNDIAATEHGWLEVLHDAVAPSVLVGARIRSDGHAIVDHCVYPYIDGNLLCLEARARGFTLRQVDTGLLHREGATKAARTPQETEAASRANQQRSQERVRALVTKGATQ